MPSNRLRPENNHRQADMHKFASKLSLKSNSSKTKLESSVTLKQTANIADVETWANKANA